jgi:hypothetical protein
MTRGHQAWIQLLELLVQKGIVSRGIADGYPLNAELEQGLLREPKDHDAIEILDAICHYGNESQADTRAYLGEYVSPKDRVIPSALGCRLELYPTDEKKEGGP